MVCTKSYNFGRLWEITPEPSWLELSFLHVTLLPSTLYNLTKFHENSSKGIGVTGRTRFRLQMDRQAGPRAITVYPEPIGRGIKIKLKWCDPWGTQGMCHWIHIIIMKNDIHVYGLEVGIWIVSEIFGFWWNERGRAGWGMIPGVARYVTLNASHHKEQQYIGLGVGIWTVSKILHI